LLVAGLVAASAAGALLMAPPIAVISIDMHAVGAASATRSAAPFALLAQGPAPWRWVVKTRRRRHRHLLAGSGAVDTCGPVIRPARSSHRSWQVRSESNRPMTCSSWNWPGDSNHKPAVYKTAADRPWRAAWCRACSSGRMGRPASALQTRRVVAGGMTVRLTASSPASCPPQPS
jgi:hypothetical protein